MLNIFKNQKTNTTDSKSLELVKEQIYSVLGKEAKSVELTINTVLEDIGFDSVKFINLLLGLEDILGVDLEVLAAEVDPASVKTVGDVMAILDKFRKS